MPTNLSRLSPIELAGRRDKTIEHFRLIDEDLDRQRQENRLSVKNQGWTQSTGE